MSPYETGLSQVVGSLDRELRSSYLLTISATDSADPPLSSATNIEVIVDDG